MTAATSDLLAAIVASTRRTVEWRRRSVLMESVERMAAAARLAATGSRRLSRAVGG
jgi:hypothetical protein